MIENQYYYRQILDWKLQEASIYYYCIKNNENMFGHSQWKIIKSL